MPEVSQSVPSSLILPMQQPSGPPSRSLQPLPPHAGWPLSSLHVDTQHTLSPAVFAPGIPSLHEPAARQSRARGDGRDRHKERK